MSNLTDLTIIIPCHQFDDRVSKAIASSQWAKEVLIVDQNSKVNWEELKQKYHFSVTHHLHLSSFSEMKNEAMKKVETEWVFFLDSDENISDELATELQNNIQENTADGFVVQRRDIFLKRVLFHGETRFVKFLRIVKKGKAEWKGKAHEEFIPHSSAKIAPLQSPLLHESHLSISEFIKKVNFYTSFVAQEKKEGNSWLMLLFFPLGKFLYTFFFRLGFLDGYRGLVYSFVMSIHSSAVRIKRYEQK